MFGLSLVKIIYSKGKTMNKEIEKRVIELAENSPCLKRKVGALLVYEQDGIWLEVATGWNHHPNGEICELPDGSTKPEVIHAEINCLIDFKENYKVHAIKQSKIKNSDLTMYISHYPCAECKKALADNGISYKVIESFIKFDKEKPRMALVPSSLGLSAARALTYGAKKYKPNNWRKTDNIECYISAMQRHFDAWRDGEENDKESKLCHLDHMAANLSFLIELKNLPKLKFNNKE